MRQRLVDCLLGRSRLLVRCSVRAGAGLRLQRTAGLAATLSSIVANANGPAWADATVIVNDGATSAVSSGSTTSSGAGSNANSCWCPGGTASGPTWGSAVTCGTGCAGGTLAGKFVSISGTRRFSAIFNSYGWMKNRSLHQSTIVQVQ